MDETTKGLIKDGLNKQLSKDVIDTACQLPRAPTANEIRLCRVKLLAQFERWEACVSAVDEA
jgi:hypothetical protein